MDLFRKFFTSKEIHTEVFTEEVRYIFFKITQWGLEAELGKY